jgi:hypothetical protein
VMACSGGRRQAVAEGSAPVRGAARLGHKEHGELEWCRRKGLGASLGCETEQQGKLGGDGVQGGRRRPWHVSGGARPPL